MGKRIIWVAEEEQAIRDVVEGTACGFKTLGERAQDAFQVIAFRETMFASNAVMCAAQFFVVFQARKTTRLGAETDAAGKDTGKKEGVIADVRTQQEAGAVVGGLQGGDHFKEIIQRNISVGKDAFGAGRFREGGEDFGDVIRDHSVIEVGTFENLPHEHIEIKPGGNAQAGAAFQQGVHERFIVQNQVTRLHIGQKFHQAIRRAEFAPQDFQDELDVLGGKLHAAIGLNHFHACTQNKRNHRSAQMPRQAIYATTCLQA